MELLKRNWGFLDEKRSNWERASWGSCRMLDEENELALLIDLPGARREDISLRHQNGYLEIEASRSWDGQEEQKAKRLVALPEINPETLRAHLENGILEIRAEREAGSTKIPIS